MLSLREALIVDDGILSADLSDGAMLLDTKSSSYFGLNRAGTLVWSLLCERRSGDDICRVLASSLGIDRKRCEPFVLAFLDQLTCAHLIKSSTEAIEADEAATLIVSGTLPALTSDKAIVNAFPALVSYGTPKHIIEAGPQGKPGGLLGSADQLTPRNSVESELTGSFVYSSYNMRIRSAWRLPELLEVEGALACDVSIRAGDLRQWISLANGRRSFTSATPTEFFIFDTSVGGFLTRGGNEIIVQTAPGADESVVRLFVLGPAFAMLLYQRGLLVLHASAVSIEGEVIAFVGKTGWGKSTMAAVFHKAGHDLVTDDMLVLALDDSPQVLALPGYSNIRLWPEAAAYIGEVTEALPRVHPSLEKRTRVLSNGLLSQPGPMRRIYILSECPELSVERLSPVESFVELIRHTDEYVIGSLEATDSVAAHFYQCARLTERVPICRLERPLRLADLTAIQAAVMCDLGA